MTDTDKLKRLKKEIKRKQFWRETRDSRDYAIDEICDADDYGAEERYVYSDWLREAILALIAENERLVDRVAELEEGLLNMKMAGDALGAGLTSGQAIEILRSEYFARIDNETSK